jgi:hypothetical protein
VNTALVCKAIIPVPVEHGFSNCGTCTITDIPIIVLWARGIDKLSNYEKKIRVLKK